MAGRAMASDWSRCEYSRLPPAYQGRSGVSQLGAGGVGVKCHRNPLASSAQAASHASEKALADLKGAKVTKEAVEAWQKFYHATYEAASSNLSAKHRAEILKNILDRW